MLKTTVFATFHSRIDAEQALQHLLDAGFAREDVSLVMSEEARAREFGPAGPSSTEGASAGAAWGSLLGALAFTLAAMSVVTLPGIGLLAVGPLLAAALGAGAGGAAGTFLGVLGSSGVSEHEARAAQDAITRGEILLAVHLDLSLAPRANAILRRDGGAAMD